MGRGVIGGVLGILLVSGGAWADAEERDRSWRWILTGPFGGEARRLAVDPRDPRRIFVGTCDGQLYLSEDGGASWKRISEFHHPGFCISRILIDAEDSQTIYVAGWSVFAESGGGIYRSRDAGRTWVLLLGTEGRAVRALAQAPSNPHVLVFAALDGVFRSEDRGETWRRISPEGDPEIRNVESVAIHPRSDQILYVGTWHLPWKTSDGGKTWVRAGSRETGILDDSEIFSILIEEREPEILWASACTGVYRSTNGGRTWTRMTGIPSRSRRVLALARAGDKTIFAGTTEGLWRSGDGGATWRLITNRRLTVQDIAVHPQEPQRVLIATEEDGIWISHDAGMTFQPSNHGFASWVITSLLPDRETPKRIYCGVMRGGIEGSFFVSEDGGLSWRVGGRVPGGVRAILQSRRDGRRLFALTDSGIFISDDRGERWRKGPSLETEIRQLAEAQDGRLLALTASGLFRYEEALGRWKRLLSGTDMRVLHVGPGGRIWIGAEGRLLVSTDGGDSWEERPISERLGKVQVLLEHPREPDLLWIGTSWGLYRSRNGGRDWERRAYGLPYADVTAIAVRWDDPRELLVTDYRTGAIYFSSDHGETWTCVNGVRSRAWRAIFDPHDGGKVFVASAGGGVYVGVRPSHDGARKMSLDFLMELCQDAAGHAKAEATVDSDVVTEERLCACDVLCLSLWEELCW